MLNPNRDFISNFEQAVRVLLQKREGRAVAIFVTGLLFSAFGLSKLGILLEIAGFMALFRGGTVLRLLKKMPSLQPLFDSPYMKQILQSIGEERTRNSLKQEVECYEPIQDLLRGEAHFPCTNILLMGPVGVGKSSFFNTINSIFRGKIFNTARSGSSEHSLTTKFRRYPIISNSSNKPLRFCLCDAMGLEQNHLMDKGNMRCLLNGQIEDKFLLDPSRSVSPDTPGVKRQPELKDHMHCVAIVIDASTVDAVDAIKDTIQNIKEMQTVMNSIDVPQVVILTNVDKVCKQTKLDASNALKSKLIAQTVGKVSEMFGLPQHSIFPVKNYEKELELDPNIDTLALLAMKGILDHADAYLFNHREEIQEKYSSQ